MKRLWIAAGISVILLALCTWSYFAINNACDQMLECVEITITDAENKDMEQALKDSEKLKEVWQSHYHKMSALIEHQELHDLMITIEDIVNFAKEEKSDELYESCKEAKTRLEHIKDSEKISWGNIF